MDAIGKGSGFLGMMLGSLFGAGSRRIDGRNPVDWASLPLPALSGGTHDPALFAGKAVLAVNVASRCVFTGQYKALEALWQARREHGLAVLGIPANDFFNQEPGDAQQIQRFCAARGVDFPLLAKQRVTGPDAHPLYRWAEAEGGRAAVPRWNFHKLLIGRDGRLKGAFTSAVPAGSKRLLQAIDDALAE